MNFGNRVSLYLSAICYKISSNLLKIHKYIKHHLLHVMTPTEIVLGDFKNIKVALGKLHNNNSFTNRWVTTTTQRVLASPAQPTAATTTAAAQITTPPPATTTSAGTTTATMIAAVAPAIVGHHLVLAIAATAVRVGTTLVPMPHQLLLVELLEELSVASLD